MIEPARHRLPDERIGDTHEFVIDGIEGSVTANVYDDGRVGELFVRIDKQGSTVSGVVDAWAISVSMMLQVGVPLRAIVDKFRGSRFEPEGLTRNPAIRFTTSPIDYVARWLELRFLGGDQ